MAFDTNTQCSQEADSYWVTHGDTSRTWQNQSVGHSWVFGLEWTATLGQRNRRWLFKQLQRQEVRWYVSAGPQGELIGMAREQGVECAGLKLCSAAVGYALSRPQGSHLLRLVMDSQRQWVVGVHHGKVLNHTDAWVSDAAALQLQAALTQRFADLVVEVVEWLDPEAVPPQQLTFLQQEPVAQALFQRLRPRLTLGARILLLVGALICLLGAAWMWQSLSWWPLDERESFDDERLGEHMAGRSTVPQRPVVEIHDPTEFLTFLQSLQQLPVDPADWLLQGVLCEIAGNDAQCLADYQRRQTATDNEALAVHAPSAWRIKPVAVDQSHFKAQIPVRTRELSRVTSTASDRWLIGLQRQTTITPDLKVGPWRDQVIETEQARYLLRTQEVSLRLPVRQWTVLGDWSLPVFWQSVRLEVLPNAVVDEHHSYLMFHLKGELRALESSNH